MLIFTKQALGFAQGLEIIWIQALRRPWSTTAWRLLGMRMHIWESMEDSMWLLKCHSRLQQLLEGFWQRHHLPIAMVQAWWLDALQLFRLFLWKRFLPIRSWKCQFHSWFGSISKQAMIFWRRTDEFFRLLYFTLLCLPGTPYCFSIASNISPIWDIIKYS